MPAGVFSLTNSSGTVIDAVTQEIGAIPPGNENADIKYGIKNNGSSAVVPIVSFYPGLVDGQHSNTSGNAISSVRVVRASLAGILKTVSIVKEDSGNELVEFTDRGKVFLKSAGGSFTDYSTGDVSFMADPGDYLYIGFNEILRNYNFEFSTPGSYSDFAWKYSDAEDEDSFTAMPGDYSDGTTGTTINGILALGTLTPALWKKTTINGYRMYWLRAECSAVTTQSIADLLTPKYVYSLPHQFIEGLTSVYEKDDGVTPGYSDLTSNITYDLANLGMVIFNSDPLSDPAHTLVGEYSYKIPQEGTYNLTFPSTITCSVNGGSAVGITADGSYKNINVIPGLEIVFNSGIAISNTATIEIADGLKYSWYAEDSGGSPGTYQNKDLTLASTGAGETTYFHYKQEPWVDVETTDIRGVEAFAYND